MVGYRELSLQRDGSVFNQIRAYYAAHLWTPRRVSVIRESLTPGQLRLEEEVARINAFGPDVIIGYGSYFGPLYRAIAARALPWHRPKVLVFGADGMPDVRPRVPRGAARDPGGLDVPGHRSRYASASSASSVAGCT